MKHDLEERLRSEARRELREAPAGIPAAVRARLADAARESAPRSRVPPFALAAGLAAAALLAYAFWPRASAPAPAEVADAPLRPSAPALAVELTQRGIQYATRIDRPLADEWHLLVADSLRLYDSLLGQLPNLPR